MNIERDQISSIKGKSWGVILVLFILLVIVTRVWAPKYLLDNNSSGQSSDDDSVGITSTQSFTIVNYSSVSLGLNALTGDAVPPPSGILSPYGGENVINLTTFSLSSSYSEVIYRNSRGLGTVSFRLERVIGQGPARIVNISTTGPIEAYVSNISSFRLVINDTITP
ncbi:hypothetical protein [Paenibacillus herberti]|uniref:Uncharacterized protein n=1 Tax=Paenibacillus herberti TaxID=1619309 RepID=A0A229P0L1_9BACL|nr:hypothetical protein [Paenibacillus herberti]OXM15776.1 hypothetical protein CGZ75_03385 [Paenibacillus herberti]